MLVGALLYLLGSLGVTMGFNVPLNHRLARVHPNGADPLAAWRAYRVPWAMWNHVRTVASLAACVAFVLAVSLR